MRDATESDADAGGAVGPDLVAACALSAVPGVGASAMTRLESVFGSFSGAMKAGSKQILAQAGLLELTPLARQFLGREPNLEELGLWALERARRAGARVLLLGDPAYPPLLRGIHQAPGILYVRGVLEPQARRVAVVGSREADKPGLEIARQLGEGFARAAVEVISGGARGIDVAAHSGALWSLGTTVAVLGCGIDVVYPPEHGDLYDRLAQGGGAVITEHPPGTPGMARNFPRRNRIISGLSSAVVVVRAASSSGALDTAKHAVSQRRPLFAVPGDTAARLSAGTNELLRLEVAKMASSARDVLEALGWEMPAEPRKTASVPARQQLSPERTNPSAARTSPGPATGSPSGDRVLDEANARVWRLLDPRLPLHADEVAARAVLSTQETLRTLTELELRGLATQRPGKYFLRREP